MVTLGELGAAERRGWLVVRLPLGCPWCGCGYQLSRAVRGPVLLISCPACPRARVVRPGRQLERRARAKAAHPSSDRRPGLALA